MAKPSFKRFTDAVSTLDSRKDSHLNDYFVKTDTYKVILDETKKVELVIGLKGSGKTALYNTLTSSSGSGQISIGISPSDAHWTHQVQNCQHFAICRISKNWISSIYS